MPAERNERGRQASGRGGVLQALRDASAPLSIVELADRVGVHPNTVRFHLATLVENAQVQRVPAKNRGPGRPAQLFQVAPGMDPTGPRHYRSLAAALARSIAAQADPRGRAIEAGRAWGRELASSSTEGKHSGAEPAAAVDRLITLLDELDFAPTPGEGAHDSEISVGHCPFLELAIEQPDVVCALHLGLMQGAMQAWQASVSVDRLDPFVTPDRCRTHLADVAG